MQWCVADLNHESTAFWHGLDCQVWIHLPLLSLAPSHLKQAASAGIKQFIGFSSTSIFTKTDSDNSHERAVIARLEQAEAALASQGEQLGINWTILRPTLIYGCGEDQNIAFIASMIRRFSFFPLAGSSRGLRQPVHAGDLAQACIAAIGNERARNRAYNLSGGETLSYREMVERVFEALGKQPRLIAMPPLMLKSAMQLLRILPAYRHLSAAMIDRMQRDMVFDHADAGADLDFHPRPFEP